MWVYDVETLRFLDVNDAALAKYGYTRAGFLALRITDIRPPEEAEDVVEAVRDRRGRLLVTSGPWRHRLRDGPMIQVEVTSHPMTFAGREAMLVSARDISQERAMEERFRSFELHDQLTGLGNRRKLMLQLADAFSTAHASGGLPALLVIDVEGLKTINSELGRDTGDHILVTIVDRLREALDAQVELFRIDGATFSALARGVATLDAARAYATNALATLNRAFTMGGRELFVSAHVGIALAEPGWGSDDLIRTADAALLSITHLRSRRIAVFNGDQNVLKYVLRGERFALEGELRRALHDDQLRLHYQPILDLRRGVLSGVEALVRWEHPQRGRIGPSEFIPIAERAGIVSAIDSWVVATACRQHRAWRRSGLPPLTMSVNVSGYDLEAGSRLVDTIAGELKRNRMDPECLEVELTESTALHNSDDVATLLEELRGIGVRIALDDFGTGYSMLDRIRDLSVDRIKVDRTFVRRITDDGGALVRAVIAMAHSLHLAVVAEGVETEDQLALLEHQGCDFAQGYLIGRPEPAEVVQELLRVRAAPVVPLQQPRLARARG